MTIDDLLTELDIILDYFDVKNPEGGAAAKERLKQLISTHKEMQRLGVTTFTYKHLSCPSCDMITSGVGTVTKLDEITYAAVILCDRCKHDVRKIAETAIFAQLAVVKKWSKR